MPTGLEFKDIAERRLEEALVLHSAGKYDGAYYLAGYVIECALKAAISTHLNYEIYAGMDGELSNFRTHKLSKLVIFAGFVKGLAETLDPKLKSAYSYITSQTDGWSEVKRYEPIACSKQKCDSFLESVQILMQWIRQHW
ncbi:HEPN domain-containing protein [Spirosoma validum]|uniref:HEPN domain-containing protein n=1 Tax=Spirosoma validum TaxID=2771355 RepID=A0A927B1N7_9BACT|nr:HEPN domain-containing protein [Spirosoma validum]MBD2753765.1 HEPN domain-containing protein [Spirosoma validum]